MKRFFLFFIALMLVCSVNVFGQQLQSVSIEKKVTDNFNLELTATPNVDGGKCTYVWNTKEKTQIIEITESGTYNVTVICGNDTVSTSVECKKLSKDAIKIEMEKDSVYVDYDSSSYVVDTVRWIYGKNTTFHPYFKVEEDTGSLTCYVSGFGKIDTTINLKDIVPDVSNTGNYDNVDNYDNDYVSDFYKFKKYVFIVGIVLAVLLVLLYVIVFVSKKNRGKNIIKAIRESEDREFKKKILSVVLDSQTFKEKLQNEIGKSAGNAKSYDSDISALQRRIATLEDSLKKANNAGGSTYASVQQTSAPTPQQPQPSKSLYAESIVDKKFNKVKENPTEDTIFELILVGDTRARVTIYRQAYQKVLANPAFLDGCSKQMIGRNSVTVEGEGRAEKDDNGKWMLTEPVKVVLR